jgi:hypothetical protein
MDINICIDRLGLTANSYKLDRAVAPHNFTYWAKDNLDAQPTQSELELAWTEYRAGTDSTQYQRNRATEYPPMADYLDGIVKGDQVQIDKYISDCQAVKDKYPKGE